MPTIDENKLKEININYLKIVEVQRRKHRKSRINKKWAKKYGYRYDEYFNGELIQRDVELKISSSSSERYYCKNFKLNLGDFK
jgi:hypothetical protein